MNQESIEGKLKELLELMKKANPKQKEQIVKDALTTIEHNELLPTLIKVVQGQNYSEETKIEALHLIECCFQGQNLKFLQITKEEKNLLKLVKICSHSYPLIKKYSKIKYNGYTPIRVIESLLFDKSFHINHIFTIILSYMKAVRNYKQSFRYLIFPKIIETIKKQDDQSVRYMVIKVLCRMFHQFNYCVKQYIPQIMPFVIDLMLSQYQLFDSSIERLPETDRYTDKFYYLKSKKWATRVYLQFLLNNQKIRQNKFCQSFNIYCLPNICRIIQQLSIQTLAKTKSLQLKIVSLLIKNDTKSQKIYSEILFYEFLPKIYNDFNIISNRQVNKNNRLQEIISRRDDLYSDSKFINPSKRILQIYICYLDTALNNGESIIIFLYNLQTKIQRLRHEQYQFQMWIRVLFKTKQLLNNHKCKENENNAIADSILVELIQNQALVNSKYQNIRGYAFSLMTVVDLVSEQIRECCSRQCFHCLKSETDIFVRHNASTSLRWILTSPQYFHQIYNPEDYHQITLKTIDILLKDGNRKEQNFKLMQLFVTEKLLTLDFSAKMFIQIVKIYKIYSQKLNKFEKEYIDQNSQMCEMCQQLIASLLKNYKQIELQIIEPALFELISLIKLDNLYILDLYLQLKKQITPVSQFYFQLVFFELVGSQRYFSVFNFEEHSSEIGQSTNKLQSYRQMFKFLFTYLKISHQQYDEVQFAGKVASNIIKLFLVIFQYDDRKQKAYVVQILMKLMKLNGPQNILVHQNQDSIEKIIKLAFQDEHRQIQILAIPMASVYLQKNLAFIQQNNDLVQGYLDNILIYQYKLNMEENVRILSCLNYLLEDHQQIQRLAIYEKLLIAAAALLLNITEIQDLQDSLDSLDSLHSLDSFSESELSILGTPSSNYMIDSRDYFDPQNRQNIEKLKGIVIEDFKKQISFIKFSRPLSFYQLTGALAEEERAVISRYIIDQRNQ